METENQKVLDSKDQYFLITKDPIQMKKILADDGFVPSDVKKVIVGPCNDRPGAKQNLEIISLSLRKKQKLLRQFIRLI